MVIFWRVLRLTGGLFRFRLNYYDIIYQKKGVHSIVMWKKRAGRFDGKL